MEQGNYSSIVFIEWRPVRLKESRELVQKAKCPKCSEDMLVLEHILEGIDTNDNRIEKIGIRGI